jgi:hypothetical protein
VSSVVWEAPSVVANQGQEQQSESERAAAVQDLRIDAYGDYLGSAEALVTTFSLPSSQAEGRAAWVALLSAKARVALIAENPAVLQDGADAMTQAVENNDPAGYEDAAENFRDAARDDIATGD